MLKALLFAAICGLPLCAAAQTPEAIKFPTIGSQAIGRATLLAIDDYSLPLRKNLCYYMTKPTVREEPLLTPRRGDTSAPDHVACHFYGTVLQEEGKFRMWYYAVGWIKEPTDFQEGPICYAESDDGIHWTRPNLGQVEINGSRNNNAIDLPRQKTQGTFIVRDDDDPDPQRRYKMVYENRPKHDKYMSVRMATSPDGIKWTAGTDYPIDDGLEPCAFYKHDGFYFINAQFAPNGFSEGGHKAGRQGFVWLSTNFKDWLQESGESFTLPEPKDPMERGLDKPGDQVHLGCAPVSMGNVLVGFYAIWHAHPNPGDWFGDGTTSGDWGLVVSNDGQHFREAVKGHVYLHGSESGVKHPDGVDHQMILAQGNGIINVGDETRIYHGRWANTKEWKDYYGEIALATLPRDRWGALGLIPGAQAGTVWTAPFIVPANGCRVTINGEQVDDMQVEVADERFAFNPALSGANAGTSNKTDGLDCPVAWASGDLKSLAGKTIRLRVHLNRKEATDEPRLFAVYIESSTEPLAQAK
ncbi:hypothetical protein PLANPX_3235 [Lacipirellula parvula]|uniref:Uncharacterized protein n=2 Tax=Lacipirellula parvula TaxID=2650471 RepID=A0A5K7XHC6_9BACT|nr:hypothetical protein PLANPX_3235 [Lacipirellula parvula]